MVKDARFRLGEPLATEFKAFRTAFYNAPEVEVIRSALKEHIDRVLDNEPERRKLYEAELKMLRKEHGPNVALIKPTKD